MGSELTPPAPASTAVAEQRCSRCRGLFPVEAGELRHAPAEWWLCVPCHAKLIGPGSRSIR
jgi:hypothetical protein